MLTVTPTSAPSAQATVSLVNTLRDEAIPAATRGTGLTAYVGGATAGFIDLSTEITDRLPLVIAIVLALSFLLLMIAFRAALGALKAVVMNLLSIAAAFGALITVAVFCALLLVRVLRLLCDSSAGDGSTRGRDLPRSLARAD